MSTKEINFNLPVFSYTYQNFLVEELAMCSNPLAMHYGNCSVIGRLVRENGQYYLENIKISSLRPDYQLPDGAIKLPLSVGKEFLYAIARYGGTLPVDVYAEIWGLAILQTKFDGKSVNVADVLPPITSCSLMMKIRELQIKMEADRRLPPREPSGFGDKGMNSTVRMALKQRVHQYINAYEPAVFVNDMQVIDQPHEMIACNLELRFFRRKYRDRDVERNKAKLSNKS